MSCWQYAACLRAIRVIPFVRRVDDCQSVYGEVSGAAVSWKCPQHTGCQEIFAAILVRRMHEEDYLAVKNFGCIVA